VTRLKWKLVLVHLEIVLILTQDRCIVYVERTIGSEIIFHARDGTPSDMGRGESCFGPFGNGVSVGVRWVHGLRQTYHRLSNRFGRTGWNSQVMWLMWNVVLVRSETVLVSEQDRCMVCAKHTIGSEIILDAPNDTPR
jgi:hypothetical protein